LTIFFDNTKSNDSLPLVTFGGGAMRIAIRIVVLLLAAALLPATAKAEWREATSEHFVIVSGGSERQLVQMTQRLEAVHWLLGQATNVTNPRNGARVRIYLVDGISDVHRAMGVTNNNSAAGFYRPSEEGAIAVVPRDQSEFSGIILYHEYAHHFMLQYMVHAYPPWLVEGFAEVVSTARFPSDNAITYGFAARHRQNELNNARWVHVRDMFRPYDPAAPRRETPSYGQYWLATHYLLFGGERNGQLTQFIRSMNGGVPIDRAYDAFAGGLDQLNADMRRYLRGNSFSYRNVPLPPNVMAAPTVRVLRPGEAAIIDDELQASRSMSAEEHVPVAMRVRGIAAQHPTDPAVALLEARLWRWADRWADAEAAVDRALAADPANVRALALKGRLMLERREAEGGDMDPAFVRSARAYIIRANRTDPEDQMPLMAYYDSFRLAGERPDAAAIDGLRKVMELVPQVQTIRVNLINEMIARRDLDEARALLRPLAFDPHRPGGRAWAERLIAWIDGGATGERPGAESGPTAGEGDDDDDSDDEPASSSRLPKEPA
jgi:Flp pilus assembly protein TadD